MSDECIELDRADTGIVARSSAIIGESEHDTSEDPVRKSLSLFWGLNDPHKFLAKIGVGRSTSGYAKIRKSLFKVRMLTFSTYRKDARKSQLPPIKVRRLPSGSWRPVNFFGTAVSAVTIIELRRRKR